MKPVAALVAITLLAACSRGGQPDNGNAAAVPPANETVNEAAVSTDMAPAPLDNAATENAVTPTPAPSPSTKTIARSGPIPAAFRGRWGLVVADCDPQRDDNKGLMTVAADSLKFYESLARPTSVTASSATVVEATLDWSGEGQTWRSTAKLTLSDGGRTLTRVNSGEPMLVYSRCAA